MSSIYHAGELAVQAQAGVSTMAQRIGRSIRSTLPAVAQTFLAEQSMAVLGSLDEHERVWASLLTGKPGFMRVLTDQSLDIDAFPVPGDPLHTRFQQESELPLGLLVIDLATRRRMRINGRAHAESESRIVLDTQQVYANCPKYIQVRILENEGDASQQIRQVQQGDSLTSAQQRWTASLDTFFIATAHESGGADVSHRGGNPGFVRVLDASTLLFPDYAGNTMFQTLGNISVNPAAGLLMLDFAHGSTLQLTGHAEIIWDAQRVAEFTGAQRLVEFHIIETVEQTNALPFRSRDVAYSPFNPK